MHLLQNARAMEHLIIIHPISALTDTCGGKHFRAFICLQSSVAEHLEMAIYPLLFGEDIILFNVTFIFTSNFSKPQPEWKESQLPAMTNKRLY